MRTKDQVRSYNQKYYYTHQDDILAQKRDLWKDAEFANCRKEFHRKWYLANKDRMLKAQRAYYSLPENRIKKIFSKTRERAKVTGIEFSIDLSDIILPEVCPYLGIKLTHDLGKGQLLTNSSIDRIDNTKGYIKGNIRIISRLANSMKSDSTRKQREAFSKAVLADETL